MPLRGDGVRFPVSQIGAQRQHEYRADDEQGSVDFNGSTHTEMFGTETNEQGGDGLHSEANHSEQAE